MASSDQRMRVDHKISRSARVFSHAFLVPLFCSIFLSALFSDFIPTAFGAYADQRFFQCLLMVVVIVASLLWSDITVADEELVVSIWPNLLIAAGFLVLSVPYAFSAFNWVEPGLFAIYFLAFAVLGWRIRGLDISRYAVELFVIVAAIACFFYAAMTMTVYLFAITDRFSELTDVIPWGFVNMRYWSHLATWLLPIMPLALLVGPFADNRKWQWCVSFSAAIWWWMVFMTTARGTMLGLALAVVVAILFFGKMLIPWARIFGRFILFGGIAWVLLSVLIPSFVFEEVTVRSLHSDSSGRLPLWREAWLMSFQNFPWGLGPQSWLTHESISGQDQLKIKLGHPHNMYLMWAAEYGWLVIAAIFVLVMRFIKNLLVRAGQLRFDPAESPTGLVALTVSAVAGMIHAGVSAVFIVPASMLVGLCVLSLFWALSTPSADVVSPSDPTKTEGLRGSVFRMTLAAVVLSAGALWVKEVWDYHQAMEADLVRYEQGSYAPFFPRFWFHGNFPRIEQGAGPAFAKD